MFRKNWFVHMVSDLWKHGFMGSKNSLEKNYPFKFLSLIYLYFLYLFFKVTLQFYHKLTQYNITSMASQFSPTFRLSTWLPHISEPSHNQPQKRSCWTISSVLWSGPCQALTDLLKPARDLSLTCPARLQGNSDIPYGLKCLGKIMAYLMSFFLSLFD